MNLLAPEYWAVWVAAAIIVIASVLQLTKGKVPNIFTLTLILAGWVTAGLLTFGVSIPTVNGSLAGSFAATFIALGLSIPFYKRGLGAGCIKAQMAFGAWVGCSLGMADGIQLTIVCTLAAEILTFSICSVWARYQEDEFAEFPAQLTHTLGTAIGICFCAYLGVF